MAQGISTHWRVDGPVSRVSQARYLAAQARAECANEGKPVGEWRWCPKDSSRCEAAQIERAARDARYGGN